MSGQMRVLDLFSGIGGFSLGLQRAGMQTVAFCEIDPFCRAVLAKHWPEVPCYEDVRELDAARLRDDGIGRVDVVTGGYPCQPFSHAGQRSGHDDPRHLWPAMRRVIGEIRPSWVIAENVAGHITLGLDEVLAALESDGYAARAIVVPAAAVDAPHIRQRVWIAARDTDRDSKSVVAVHAEMAGLCGSVADADSAGSQGHRGLRQRARQRAFGPRSGAEPRAWQPEPAVGRVAHGIPRRVDRLRALGNAVVPQIPEMIGRAILATEAA
jgi:DNA (cytosine-5)-methyltransferase 1